MALRCSALVFAAATVSVLAGSGVAYAQSGATAVVELFTSQGCSSCPPADKLLFTYARRPNVVALTYNVDYWDYLGWKDTLAQPAFSKRQREYARTRGDGAVYTPQVVVNGVAHAVGSKAKRIDAAMTETATALDGRRPGIEVVRAKEMIEIRIGKSDRAPASAATVWIATVQPKASITVKHGENRDSSLAYVNVVRTLQAVGMWSGTPTTLTLRESAVMPDKSQRCVVLIQEGTTGPMLAAAWLP